MGFIHGSCNIVFCFFLFSILVSKVSALFDPTTVLVKNDIDPQVVLKIHCKSLDDDLGDHSLNFGGGWDWQFRVGFGTTYFTCDYEWYDNGNKRLYRASHEVYKATLSGFKAKYYIFCHSKCVWSARRDGLYLYRRDKKRWEQRYTWDP